MEATAALGPFADAIERYMLSWSKARDVYWSFGGLASLLPIGGQAVWGSSSTGWTDTPADSIEVDLTTDQEPGPRSMEYLYRRFKSSYPDLPSATLYNYDVQNPKGKITGDPRNFANPLASALPAAPKLKVFCIYGVGIPTERAYKYSAKPVRWMWADTETRLIVDPGNNPFRWSSSMNVQDAIADMQAYLGTKDENRPIYLDAIDEELEFATLATGIKFLTKLAKRTKNPEAWMRIDKAFVSETDYDPWGNGVDGIFKAGVSHTDGDGTVPLTSLGYMCSNGWRDFPELNPANVSVWVKELKNNPALALIDPRGGPSTAKHVEIIGNRDFITDLLNIVAGQTEYLEQDHIVSNISEIAPVITARLRQYHFSDDA